MLCGGGRAASFMNTTCEFVTMMPGSANQPLPSPAPSDDVQRIMTADFLIRATTSGGMAGGKLVGLAANPGKAVRLVGTGGGVFFSSGPAGEVVLSAGGVTGSVNWIRGVFTARGLLAG